MGDFQLYQLSVLMPVLPQYYALWSMIFCSVSSLQSPYFWPSQNWEPDNVDYGEYNSWVFFMKISYLIEFWLGIDVEECTFVICLSVLVCSVSKCFCDFCACGSVHVLGAWLQMKHLGISIIVLMYRKPTPSACTWLIVPFEKSEYSVLLESLRNHWGLMAIQGWELFKWMTHLT